MIETLLQVMEQEPERPRSVKPTIDRDLESICLKCLEKDPERRYSTADALAEDLDAFLCGEPVLAEVSSTGRLMRMLLRDTRHTSVMALWGRVWMWHASQVFALFLASNVLIWAGIRNAAPYVALWVIGLFSLMIPAWYYRFRNGPSLTPIERQLGQVWGMFAASCFLTGAIVVLMGLEVTRLLPLVVLQCGLAAGCMATILGGSFYVLAAACAACAAVTRRRAQLRPRDLRRCIRRRFVRPGLEILALTSRSGNGHNRRQGLVCRLARPFINWHDCPAQENPHPPPSHASASPSSLQTTRSKLSQGQSLLAKQRPRSASQMRSSWFRYVQRTNKTRDAQIARSNQPPALCKPVTLR